MMQASEASKATISEHRLPLWVRTLNKVGDLGDRVGLRTSLDEGSLLDAAMRRTGLQELGDESFRENLRALLASYEDEADLTAFGRISVREDLIRSLSKRLRIQDDLRREPAILDVEIRRPLFIIGLPRTGTTLLLNLLSQDPAARIPLLWELMAPSPPPVQASRANDPRIEDARKVLDLYFGLIPEMRTIHPQHPESPDECTFLLQNCFISLDASARASLRGYVRYLLGRDLTPEYQFYKQQLQLLSFRASGEHLVLKSPVHLLALEPLLQVFPDAAIVQTHRAPRDVIPSLCSLTWLIRQLFVRNNLPERVGEDILSWWSELLDRGASVRDKVGNERFYDLDYGDLLEDPIAAIQGIYDHFQYPFSSAMKDGCERWLAENPQDKHGRHRYTASQFGLSSEVIDERFSKYIERFGLHGR